MKKHELLEKAMRDYPAGTRFTFYGEKFESSYESTGAFICWKEGFNKSAHKDSIWRLDKYNSPSGVIYDGISQKWSEIVKPNEIEIYQKSKLIGVVNINGFVAKCKSNISCISTQEIEDIYKASQKLQSEYK